MYLDFLRDLLKDNPFVEMCYMTSILPVKKYRTDSALNIFDEISMIQSKPLSQYMGFTEKKYKIYVYNSIVIIPRWKIGMMGTVWLILFLSSHHVVWCLLYQKKNFPITEQAQKLLKSWKSILI